MLPVAQSFPTSPGPNGDQLPTGAGQMSMSIFRTLVVAFTFITLAHAGSAHSQVEVGDGVPRTKLLLIDGTTLDRRALEDKVVLTVFWATWCHICMRELPEFQKLRDRHHSDGFEVLALSVDETLSPVQDYVARSGFTFPVAMRTASLKKAWGPVQGTPLIYISDRSGTVKARYLGATEIGALEQTIMSLLAANNASQRESVQR
ncbi:TlpA family protein disulfide reductase [Rhodocyclaceae bacterium SMB388]